MVLLRAIDKLEPGLVDFRRVNQAPKSKYHRIENGNYVIELCKAMELRLTAIGGMDVVDGNAKLVHAVLFQMLRYGTLKMLSSLAVRREPALRAPRCGLSCVLTALAGVFLRAVRRLRRGGVGHGGVGQRARRGASRRPPPRALPT